MPTCGLDQESLGVMHKQLCYKEPQVVGTPSAMAVSPNSMSWELGTWSVNSGGHDSAQARCCSKLPR